MCELDEFLKMNPRSRKIQPFSDQSLAALSGLEVPEDIVGFLKSEGYSTYRDDFLTTTLPQEHFATLTEWGLDGSRCFAFLKTAFGGLCYSNEGHICQLDPISGYVYKDELDFCNFMNAIATMEAFTESTYFDVYERIKPRAVIGYDEMYAMVPALPLGGSFETSTYEVVKMREHLALLAQLFDGRARIV